MGQREVKERVRKNEIVKVRKGRDSDRERCLRIVKEREMKRKENQDTMQEVQRIYLYRG